MLGQLLIVPDKALRHPFVKQNIEDFTLTTSLAVSADTALFRRETMTVFQAHIDFTGFFIQSRLHNGNYIQHHNNTVPNVLLYLRYVTVCCIVRSS